MGVDVAEEVEPRHAVRRAQLLERVLADAPHPFAGVAEVDVRAVEKPLLGEDAARLGEESRLQDRRIRRVDLLEAEIDVAAVDADLVRGARLAAVRVAPGIKVGGRALVQRLVAREPKLVRGEHVAERREARHPLGVVRKRPGHDYVLALHQRVLDAAHRAHRGEQRVRARVHQVRHVPQVDFGHAVDARLVSGAVDHDGRVPPRECDDRGELGHGDEIGRLDMHRHAQLVRRLQVLLRRHERVEAHEVESQLLPLRGDHAVVVQVAR